MAGLRGQTRVPEAGVRVRRNADDLASSLSFVGEIEPIFVNDSGFFDLRLDEDGGLVTVNAELRVDLQDEGGLSVNGDGLFVLLPSDAGLQTLADGLSVLIADDSLSRGGSGLQVNIADGAALSPVDGLSVVVDAPLIVENDAIGLDLGDGLHVESDLLAVDLEDDGNLVFNSGQLALDDVVTLDTPASTPSAGPAGTGRVWYDSSDNRLVASENGQPAVALVGNRLLAKSTTPTTVTDTTDETDVFSVQVLADRLGDDGIIQVALDLSDLDMPDGATLTLRLYYGSTEVAAVDVENDTGQAFTDYSGEARFVLMADGDAQNQRGYGKIVAGNGVFTGPSVRQTAAVGSGDGTASEDATTELELRATVQWDAASTSRSVTAVSTFAELMQ